MKEYHIFAGQEYYPSKGLGDFVTSCGTEEEAMKAVKALEISDGFDWITVAYTGGNEGMVSVYEYTNGLYQ